MKIPNTDNIKKMAAGNESSVKPRQQKISFQIQNSLNLQIEEISSIARNTKHNKALVARYVNIMKQITKALSGAEASFLRGAEFYSDLRETLSKIQVIISDLTKRKAMSRLLLAKKDNLTCDEMQCHADTLCGRIFLSYAQRMQMRSSVLVSGSGKSINLM